MNVILLSDVKALGKKGQMVKVSDGYARNFLFPKKLAAEASNSSVNEMKARNDALEFHKAEEKQRAIELKSSLDNTSLTFKAKAGNNGKLFGAVTAKEIAQELSKVHNLEIDKKKINLSEPLKTFGIFKVSLKLYTGVSAEITVNIVEEQ